MEVLFAVVVVGAIKFFAVVESVIVEDHDLFMTIETRGILLVCGDSAALVLSGMVSATEEGTPSSAIVLSTITALGFLVSRGVFELAFYLLASFVPTGFLCNLSPFRIQLDYSPSRHTHTQN